MTRTLKWGGDYLMFGIKFDRMFVLAFLATLGGVFLFALIALNAIGESGGRNTYAALANSFLNGQLDTPGCSDADCAQHDGKEWVVNAPAPALIALPFVATFGPDFSGFIFLALIMNALSLF